MTIETVYLGKDNTIDKELREEGAAVDLSSVTRMTLDFNGTVIDSATASSAFDWSEGSGKVIFSLGGQSITAGDYEEVELTVYDASNTNGIVWGTFPVTVK